MNQSTLGFVRALGVVIVFAVLTFVGDVSHLSGIVSPALAALISAVALAIEHGMEQKSGKALFGAVRSPNAQTQI